MDKKEVMQLLAAHQKTVQAIISDYLEGGDMLMEIEAAFEKTKESIEQVFDEGMSYNEVIKQLKNLKDEIEPGDLLPLMNNDDLCEYLQQDGYQVFKIDSIVNQSKLEDFLCSGIYPSYNEQRANLFM